MSLGNLTSRVGLGSIRAQGIGMRNVAGQGQEGMVTPGDGDVAHA